MWLKCLLYSSEWNGCYSFLCCRQEVGSFQGSCAPWRQTQSEPRLLLLSKHWCFLPWFISVSQTKQTCLKYTTGQDAEWTHGKCEVCPKAFSRIEYEPLTPYYTQQSELMGSWANKHSNIPCPGSPFSHRCQVT